MPVIGRKKLTEAKLDSLEKAGYITFRKMVKESGAKKERQSFEPPLREKSDSATDVYGINLRKKKK